MKPKKRHQSSSEDSAESDDRQSSSSDSESEDSSASEHRYKKKKKREQKGSSDSDSDSNDGQRRAKKRKHKKKKKKHMKRKRRSESVVKSGSEAKAQFSMSDGEVSPKKKHKKHHKHKRSHSSSASEKEEECKERRLHSVVKERRSSEDGERPPASYYQFHRPASPAENYVDDREREVMRFYRGSSKERQYHEQYPYEQESNGRFDQDSYAKDTAQNAQCNSSGDQNRSQTVHNRGQKDHCSDHDRRQKYHQRNPRYEGNHKPPEYPRRPRVESFQPREDTRSFNRNYNQYEERPKRREFEEGRDYRERRGPPESDRYREREYPERRDRYREEPFHPDRSRDVRRDKPPPLSRPDRSQPPPPPHHHSAEERYREINKPRLERDERTDRYRDGRDERRERPREDRSTGGIRPSTERRPTDARRPIEGRQLSAERRPTEGRLSNSAERRPNDGRRPAEGRRTSAERRPADNRRSNSAERRPSDGRRPNDDRRSERARPEIKSEPRGRDRKTRFGDADKEFDWGKEGDKKDVKPTVDKEKPNFGLSGKLTADTNTVNGVVIKYSEPEDAKQPKRKWRFYPFKGDKVLPILYIHRQSAFLLGRDKKVCDITLDHPSISKQHAALQYRATPFTRDDGTQGRRVRPYVIDLDSANGTFVNNKKIEPRRYVELLERDIVKFGFSERDYVLLHENSKDEAQDDDNETATIGAAVTTTAQIKAEKRIKTEITEDGE